MQSVGMIAFVLNYTNITCILVQSVGMIVFDLNYTNVSHMYPRTKRWYDCICSK